MWRINLGIFLLAVVIAGFQAVQQSGDIGYWLVYYGVGVGFIALMVGGVIGWASVFVGWMRRRS